jgi:hypothetical protein
MSGLQRMTDPQARDGGRPQAFVAATQHLGRLLPLRSGRHLHQGEFPERVLLAYVTEAYPRAIAELDYLEPLVLGFKGEIDT